MYFSGESVAQDDGEACRWWKAAADQDHAEAQYWLGRMYIDGRGVEKDFAAAITW